MKKQLTTAMLAIVCVTVASVGAASAAECKLNGPNQAGRTIAPGTLVRFNTNLNGNAGYSAVEDDLRWATTNPTAWAPDGNTLVIYLADGTTFRQNGSYQLPAGSRGVGCLSN
jgi:hypothetical protein